MSLGYAVAAPADHRTEKARIINIILRLLLDEHYVAQNTLLIRNEYAHKRCAKLCQYYCHIVFIRKGIQIVFCSVVRFAVKLFLHDKILPTFLKSTLTAFIELLLMIVEKRLPPDSATASAACYFHVLPASAQTDFSSPAIYQSAYANGFSVLYGTPAGWL